jgi:hypothetical protein
VHVTPSPMQWGQGQGPGPGLGLQTLVRAWTDCG